MQLYPRPEQQLGTFLVEHYEKEAQRFWEKFYRRHGVNFFKDRHYLHKEFPELFSVSSPIILEVGCGVGNSCFPLLEVLPTCHIIAVDFSSRAVELLRTHDAYRPDRIDLIILDITAPHFHPLLQTRPVDFCLLIFVLSAISPEKMPRVIDNLRSVLRPGVGTVLFRDYAEGDLAQERLERKPHKKKLGINFYIRGDGTRCYYFTEAYLRTLFQERGFVCHHSIILEREIENRHQRVQMRRKWIQAVFIRHDIKT